MKIKNVTGSSVILRKAVPDDTMLFGRGITVEAGAEVILYDCYAQLSPDLQEAIDLGRIQITGTEEPPHAPPTANAASKIATSGLPVLIDSTPPLPGEVLKAIDAEHAEWGTDAGGVTGSGTQGFVPKWDSSGLALVDCNLLGSGPVLLRSPDAVWDSGLIEIRSGNSGAGGVGDISLTTGSGIDGGDVRIFCGNNSSVGGSVFLTAGNSYTIPGDIVMTPGNQNTSPNSQGYVVLYKNVKIPTLTPPTVGQVLSASNIDGTLQWANAISFPLLSPSSLGVHYGVGVAGTGMGLSGAIVGSPLSLETAPDSGKGIALICRDNSSSGAGGELYFHAGSTTGASSTDGGDIRIIAGSRWPPAIGRGGDILIQSGTTNWPPSGRQGNISIQPYGKTILAGNTQIQTASTYPPVVGQVLSSGDVEGSLRWVTPVRKFYDEHVGNALDLDFTVAHNLGTKRVTVAVYRNASPYDEVLPDVEHTTDNDVTLKFASAPGADEYTCVVVG